MPYTVHDIQGLVGMSKGQCIMRCWLYLMSWYILLFVSEHRGAIIQDLLSFWTSSPKIPAAHEGLTLHFADNAGTFPFPVANTCFRQLTIPVQYKSYADFAAKMDVALKFGSKGFSEV